MDVAIVTLLSVVLAALLAMPWWIFRMLDSLRKELTAKIDGLEARTDAKFADIDTKFADLEARIDAKFADFEARTDAKFADLEAKLSAKIDGLGHDVAKLSERVARIEGHLFGIERPNPADSDPGAEPPPV